jgi:hypothetical protein
MHPHLFWGVLALLNAVHIPLFVLILRAFNALLGSLQLWNLPCQQILQVASPKPLSNSTPPSGTLHGVTKQRKCHAALAASHVALGALHMLLKCMDMLRTFLQQSLCAVSAMPPGNEHAVTILLVIDAHFQLSRTPKVCVCQIGCCMSSLQAPEHLRPRFGASICCIVTSNT